MLKELYIKEIASILSVKDWQVENCIELLDDGATVPFISRYRKERTGSLTDEEVASVKHYADAFTALDKRKETVVEVIEAAGAMTQDLRIQIENCVDSTLLEDIYLPYRPKRRTRATAAKEAGLEPLADMIWNLNAVDPQKAAAKFVPSSSDSVESALAGARDIIAEKLSETATVRDTVRQIMRTRRIVTKKSRKADPEKSEKYRSCINVSESILHIAPHRLLAILRAADEGVLSYSIDADAEKCCKKLYYDFCKERRFPQPALSEQLNLALADAYSRLIEPSVSAEVIREAKEKADKASIAVFGDNLRQLLLAPPVGQKRTLAIDPGFRTGCKVVCLDEQGTLLHYETIFPHPPVSEKVNAIRAVADMVSKYGIQVIAIGNGTASRETEEFIRRVPKPDSVRVFTVSEDGASIYSASETAREEFPDYDVTVRGAVSIGRRLMDPLAELVKIDPKSLGVGQYQHDVDQTLLKEKLDDTVEFCVNSVGVNLNTASKHLLSYVAGVGPSLAENIVAYRSEHGAYTSRAELKNVKRLGDKAFEQCAAFLRIHNASNPLDNSAVHPESYGLVEMMASDLGVSSAALVGNADLLSKVKPDSYVSEKFGLPTVMDILKELVKPGLDPRESAQEFEFSSEIHSIDDLASGMELPGIVTNVTAFGAFVDIGIKQNGLIHISQLHGKTLKLHEKIKVKVVSVDLDRLRIGLRLA